MPEDIVYAIHDFVAENEDEITFHIGDTITVLEKDDKYMDGWWQGRNPQGRVGLFPMNYTSTMKPSSSSTTDSSPPTSNSSRPTSSSNVTPDECHEDTKLNVASDALPPPPPPPAPTTSTSFHPPRPKPSESTPTTKPEVWSVDQVADWLRSVGLDNVAGQFVEQEISGDILMELNGDALKELGITAYGRRYKIMHAIDALKANHQHHQPPTMTPATTAPVSPTAATAAEGTDGMYQFPRKAPMPPHDSFLTVSPTSSSSMSRSNTFRTVSSKVSSSSSSNGGNVTSTTTSIDKASQPKSSFENNIILSDPFAPAAGMQETTTTPIHPMDYGIGRKLSVAQSVRPAEPSALSRASADAFKAPDYEGWLHKQGDKYKTWNKRWFVLKGPNLFYFKSPKDTRMRGIIHLRGYKIVPDESIHAGKYSFKAQHERERTFYFYTDTKESLRMWIKLLMKATIIRDFASPVMSSNHVATVPLDVARQLRPRPPSMLLSKAQQQQQQQQHYHHEQRSHHPLSLPPSAPLPATPSMIMESHHHYPSNELPMVMETVLSDDDEDLIDPLQHRMSHRQGKWESADDYIHWVNEHIVPPIHDLSDAFRNGEALILLLEALGRKTVRRPQVQPGTSANMIALDNIVAAFKFMGREGVVVDGKYTIKDVFAGDEDKIMDMLDAIIDWSEKNGFKSTAVA